MTIRAPPSALCDSSTSRDAAALGADHAHEGVQGTSTTVDHSSALESAFRVMAAVSVQQT
jgi:hypothetical protein